MKPEFKSHTKMFFVLMCIISGGNLFAQSLGIKAGINYSGVYKEVYMFSENSSKIEPIPGFQIGLAGEVQINKFIRIESELIISSKGYLLKPLFNSPDVYKITYMPIYLEFPVHFKIVQNIKKFKLYELIGPYFGVAIGGTIKYEHLDFASGVTNTEKDNYTRHRSALFDIGLNAGIGVEVRNYNFEFRYQFTSLFCKCNISNQTRVLSLSMGYRFLNKGLKTTNLK